MARPFFTYMLRCADGSYYLGHTDDIERRVSQHEAGVVAGYAATRLPIRLVWFEEFPTREEAKAAELQMQSAIHYKQTHRDSKSGIEEPA